MYHSLVLVVLIVSTASLVASAGCPFATSSAQTGPVRGSSQAHREAYHAALAELDWEAVREDITNMLVTSQDFWPADFGNYGPFMIRQAWHCSGSYRSFDGLGGCDGGRQRFDPERSWPDNTNLDKAKRLLWPIKEKYGLGLSWGDLIMLTGTTAIASMGGPVLGFCGGRIDDFDGTDSYLLGPTEEQETTYPCPVNGQCTPPFGTTTIGLIYVNPEGPMGQPIPDQSALQVRSTFGQMGMNDMETVALIGGGHAFGKTHGACPNGPGPSPQEDPANPWPGECGTGKGPDTFTSGFEGPWTFTPTNWSNSYFLNLLKNKWQVVMSPGGHHQWQTVNGPKKIMMLTSDISLLNDPAGQYQKLVQLFAANQTLLEDTFAHAWYKLASRDMGPVTRCVGPWVPPAQPFQFPLPETPSNLPDFDDVRTSIIAVMRRDASNILRPDTFNGNAYYGALFVHLAWQAASTFRQTDYLGGANGARIRFAPQANWPFNVGMNQTMEVLRPIYDQFNDNGFSLSWADLIVLAGTVALEEGVAVSSRRSTTSTQTKKPQDDLDFCGGRTDASDGKGSNFLAPNGNYSLTVSEMKAAARQLGLSHDQVVALSARLRSPSQMARLGYFGSWTTNPTSLSNEYFTTLLNNDWEPFALPNGLSQYKAVGQQLFMTQTDLNLKYDATYLAIAQEFASDNDLFLLTFQSAWTQVMNADRFDGPVSSVCV